MQTEGQKQTVTAPEIAPKAKSRRIKKQHGGERPGAGRKPNLVQRMIGRLMPATAMEVLATVDVEKAISWPYRVEFFTHTPPGGHCRA